MIKKKRIVIGNGGKNSLVQKEGSFLFVTEAQASYLSRPQSGCVMQNSGGKDRREQILCLCLFISPFFARQMGGGAVVRGNVR